MMPGSGADVQVSEEIYTRPLLNSELATSSNQSRDDGDQQTTAPLSAPVLAPVTVSSKGSFSDLSENSIFKSGPRLPAAKKKLLYRFKRRIPCVNEIWSAPDGPVIVKVGSETESVRSKASTVSSSWRFPLPELRSGISTLSTGTNKTLRYEDFESFAEIQSAQNQNRQISTTEPEPKLYKNVISISICPETDSGQPEYPFEPDIVVQNRADDSGVIPPPVTRIPVDPAQGDDGKQLRNQRRARTRTTADRRPSRRNTSAAPPAFLHHSPSGVPTEWMGPFSSQPPWAPPILTASTAHHIEMTAWRANPSFDSSGSEELRPNNASHIAFGNVRADDFPYAGNVLAPEDLGRLFPGPLFPPSLSRLEEEMALAEESKNCCGMFRLSQSSLIRWFIAVISLVGMACVIVGVALGALTVSGTARLTLCLLLIGVGIVLLTVSGIAWRLTSMKPSTRPTCCGLLGINLRQPHTDFPETSRQPYSRVHNRPALYNHHPFPGIMLPEFGWRPPPPSYQASVREAAMNNLFVNERLDIAPSTNIGSPPPTYRTESRGDSRPSVSDVIDRPPSYRSEESSPVFSVTTDRVVLFEEREAGGLEERPSSAIADATDRVYTDDTQQLLLMRTSPDTSAENLECVSVIDCSSAVPVGFHMPEAHGAPRPRNSRRQLPSFVSSRRPVVPGQPLLLASRLPPRTPAPHPGFLSGPVCFLPDSSNVAPQIHSPRVIMNPSRGRNNLLSDIFVLSGRPSYV